MSSPEWIAATAGQPPLAAQVNQFLTTHPTTYVYTGVEQNHLATAGAGTVASNGLWIAQQFTAASVFTTGRVVLTLAVTGSPGPLSVSVCADNAGVPSSTVLAGPVSIPAQFVPGTAGTVSVPLPGLTVAAGTSYWVVAQPAGDASDFYAWSRANGTSGAATSSDGVTWTAQAYNLLFQVWDDTAVLPLVHTWEDAGARWTGMTANAQGRPTSVQEFTAGQTASGYASSSATVAYSGSVLTGVVASGAPVWSAPHNGVLGNASGIAGAGQINQFLTTHGTTAVYQGNSVLTPNGAGGSPWFFVLGRADVDQPFTMSGTSIGRVSIPLLAVGNGADLLVSLCADNGSGQPGTVVTQTRVPANWVSQLSAISGVAGSSYVSPVLQYTDNPLALAQFNGLWMGAFTYNNWPYPTNGSGGPSTSPTSTSFGTYFVQLGGASGSTYYDNVYTIGFDAIGHLSQAVPQPSLPVATDGSAGAVVVTDSSGNNTLVFIGGSVSGGSVVSTVYTADFDAATGGISSWSSQAALPVANQYFATASYNGFVYAIGGSNPGKNSVYYAQVTNGQIAAWNTATPMPIAMGFNFAMAVDGYLFVFGGYTGTTGSLSSVYWAQINTDGSLGNWMSGPSLPVAVSLLNNNAAQPLGDFGVFGNGSATFFTLGVTEDGPAFDWQYSNFNLGGYFYAATPAGAGIWQYYGLYSSTYSTMPVYLTPRISVPLPAGGLTSGATYHILMQQQGGDLNNYLRMHGDHSVFPGNPLALSSNPGTYSWSTSYGSQAVPLEIYDQTVATTPGQLPLHLWVDNGARITTIVTSTTPDQRPLGLLESTVQSYALNANQGFETGTDPWFASGGDLEQSDAQAFEGKYSAQVTPSGVDANVYLGSENLPCMPGQSVTVTGWIWCTNAVTGNVSLSVNWYTLTGTYISTSSNDVSVPAATWTQLTNEFTAPAGAYQFAIAATVSGTPAATQIFYVDQVRAYYTYTGPLNATVTGIEYAGTYPWPWPGTGTVALA